MSTLRFTPEHEWLRLEATGELTVGITSYAQQALGDVVFVQLPEPGEYGEGNELAVLEFLHRRVHVDEALTQHVAQPVLAPQQGDRLRQSLRQLHRHIVGITLDHR